MFKLRPIIANSTTLSNNNHCKSHLKLHKMLFWANTSTWSNHFNSTIIASGKDNKKITNWTIPNCYKAVPMGLCKYLIIKIIRSHWFPPIISESIRRSSIKFCSMPNLMRFYCKEGLTIILKISNCCPKEATENISANLNSHQLSSTLNLLTFAPSTPR